MKRKKDLVDSAAGLLTVLTEMLGTKQPQRFSLGLVIGIAISGIITIFRSYIEENSSLFSGVSDITGLHCLAFGLIIVFSPLIFNFLNPRREEVFDEKLEKTFATLGKALKDGGLAPHEKRIIYLQLAQKVVDSVELNEGIQNKVRRQDELNQLEAISEVLDEQAKG